MIIQAIGAATTSSGTAVVIVFIAVAVSRRSIVIESSDFSSFDLSSSDNRLFPRGVQSLVMCWISIWFDSIPIPILTASVSPIFVAIVVSILIPSHDFAVAITCKFVASTRHNIVFAPYFRG